MQAKPKFWIANWAQPFENFSVFKADGFNVMNGPDRGKPERISQAAIHAKIKDLGLWYIDVPKTMADLDRMLADENCLAIGLPDEPDLRLPPPNKDKPGFDKGVADWMALYKWIADSVNSRPVRKKMYINFTGARVIDGVEWGYRQIMQVPFVAIMRPGDILSGDYYPENQNSARYPSTFPSLVTKWLKTTFPGFEVWGYHESSDIRLDGTAEEKPGRAPTPAELQEQVDLNIAEGVQGLSFFTHQLQGESWTPEAPVDAWDARSPELRILTRQIATKLNQVLPPPVDVNKTVSELIKALDTLTAEVKTNSANTKNALDTITQNIAAQRNLIQSLQERAITDLSFKRG